MSLWFLIKLSFFILYTSICAFLASIMYNDEKKYYIPIYVKKKRRPTEILYGCTDISRPIGTFFTKKAKQLMCAVRKKRLHAGGYAVTCRSI